MKRLSRAETQSLLTAMSILHLNHDHTPVTSRIFRAVREVASADIYGLNTFHPRGYWLEQTWQEPISSASPAELEIFYKFAHSHPLYHAFVTTGLPEPRKTLDFVSTKEFHSSTIYNEFYRKFGIDQQMVCGLGISCDLILMLTLNRSKKDFTESHCRKLEVLKPHLIAAYKNDEAVKQLQSQHSELEVALEASGHGAILLDAFWRIRHVTNRAQSWLATYFTTPHGSLADLPQKLKDWLKYQAAKAETESLLSEPASPLVVVGTHGRLQIRLLRNLDGNNTLLLMQEEVAISERKSKALGLTPREAGILGWVAQGKTNSEVAVLCDISERTVQKHLEHIYEKLGVETRTAAARLALLAKVE